MKISSAVADGRVPACHRGHNNNSRSYRARDNSKNPLNRIVLDNLLEFKERLKEPPSPKPRPHSSVINALEKFSECGVMRYGAVRYLRPGCGHDVFVAFSCKRRGICPSCDAKRSAMPPARLYQGIRWEALRRLYLAAGAGYEPAETDLARDACAE